MNLLARVEAVGGAIVGDAKAMAMTTEHFLGGLESEIADDAAPYLAIIRKAFVDELGYIAKQALADVKGIIATAVTSLAPQFAGNPIGLIGAVFSAVLKQMPAELGALEQLALHGLVSMAVTAVATS